MRWQSRLKRNIKPLFSFDINLKHLTTLGVGGPSECFARPLKSGDLISILEFCREEDAPVWFLGGGSNVLIPDEGLPGITIHTRELNAVMWEEKGDSVNVFAESGALLPSLLGLSLKRGWSGFEFTAGIPGTIGGALAGNAGAEGFSIGDIVKSVRVIESNGSIIQKARRDMVFSYRFSNLLLENSAITGCSLELKKSTPDAVAKRTREFLSNRRSQPIGVKTAGCIFKNPQGSSAGRLLDEAGCKGLECGGASVSVKHANFIENRGSASSNDIRALIHLCQKRVFQSSGISLVTEIRFLGVSADAQTPD